MAHDDDQKPPIDLKDEQTLRRLGQQWFAQARQQSEQDAAEINAWRLEQMKWSAASNPYDGNSPNWTLYYDTFRRRWNTMSYDYARRRWKSDGNGNE